MKRTKMIDREMLHSLKVADEAGVWGEEIPVKNSLEGPYELIKPNDSENLKEHNRVVFSSLMKSSGLSVKGVANLLGVREDTIKKMLSGKMDINYGMIHEMKKLNSEIKYTADKISHEIMKCPKEISPNIIIGEDEEGKKISAAYNCPVSVSIHLEYDGVVKKMSQPGGEWTMDSIRVILGRVIEMTDRKFLIREEK